MRWQLLIQGTDYYLDPSGLWFALCDETRPERLPGGKLYDRGGDDGRKLSRRTIRVQGSSDSLRLIVEPKKGPEAVTFPP